MMMPYREVDSSITWAVILRVLNLAGGAVAEGPTEGRRMTHAMRTATSPSRHSASASRTFM